MVHIEQNKHNVGDLIVFKKDMYVQHLSIGDIASSVKTTSAYPVNSLIKAGDTAIIIKMPEFNAKCFYVFINNRVVLTHVDDVKILVQNY